MCNWSSDQYFLCNIQTPANQLFGVRSSFLSISGTPKYEEPSESKIVLWRISQGEGTSCNKDCETSWSHLALQ